MSSPYGPPGGNGPQQWGQQPGPGFGPGTPSGGFPAQGQGAYAPGGQQYPGYGPTPGGQPFPGYGQPPGGYPQQPGFGPQLGYPGGVGQFGGTPPAGAPRKRSALPWILVGLVVVLGGLVAFLGFVTPGWFTTKVFDHAAVQNGVKQILTDEYGLEDVGEVSCPQNEKVEEGNTFECTATIKGEQKKVTITVKSKDGEYEVAKPR